MKKQRKPYTIHKTDVVIDKLKLKNILNSKKLTFAELHSRIVMAYGLDLEYKSFMSLIDNKSTWKLLYAHAISDVLNIVYTDIFKIINVDTNKVAQEKEEWKEKYQK